ncbi:peptidylprolyl isomerase [Paenibacillus sp. 1011MAR3C5]|uniref:foldase protein PrsA n=1 Tax=Paenibacillus sp. 1011MAR3C5 TaxID=1675787 RepID=UPI000E6CBC69|nr:peptidylprolyl isomerase [Paenibacillus sp. 1011MAR3C5]RJE84300.1 peptidylprolyl isomerase [Paenibacillus sp. 1011MAR3C5]
MNNKESQSNDTPIDNETAKEENKVQENDTNGETQENAVETDKPEGATDSERAVAETAVAAAAPYSAAAGVSPRPEAAAPAKKSATGWIVLSAVLAIALIVVLIKPPFGGGGNETVATVNGANISQQELYDLLVKVNGEPALDNLILEKLVKQEADAASVKFTDQDITDEINVIKIDFPSEDDFNNVLLQNNLTMEDLREDMRLSAMIRKVLEPKTTVTDEDVKAYFDANLAKFGEHGEQVRASHILVETKEEADAILAELKGGADFAETAKAKSGDGSAANGGDLGFFSKEDMVEPFSKAAFALETGAVSEVVQSDFGFHIIKKTDYREAAKANFDENKDLIRTKLVADEVRTLSSAWITEIREKAKITNNLTKTPADGAANTGAEGGAVKE